MSTRRKPTTGHVLPRQWGAHGVTLTMQAIKRPEPTYLVEHRAEWVKTTPEGRKLRVPRLMRVGVWESYTNPDADRSLPGKARRKARRAARA